MVWLHSLGRDSVAYNIEGSTYSTLQYNLSDQDSELSLEKRVLIRTHGVTETQVASLGKKGEFSHLCNREEGDGREQNFRDDLSSS